MNSNPSCTKATALSTCPLPSSSPLGAVSCACMVSHFSRVQLFATLWTVAHQAPLSRGFSRQEYWSGLQALLQEIFPTQGMNPGFPHCRQILYHVNLHIYKIVQLLICGIINLHKILLTEPSQKGFSKKIKFI